MLAGPALVTLAPDRVDLGMVPRAGRAETPITVSNPYEKEFLIAHSRSTCPCLSLRLERDRVRTGETVARRVRLGLSHEPDYVGTLSTELLGVDPSGSSVFRLPVRVRVVE